VSTPRAIRGMRKSSRRSIAENTGDVATAAVVDRARTWQPVNRSGRDPAGCRPQMGLTIVMWRWMGKTWPRVIVLAASRCDLASRVVHPTPLAPTRRCLPQAGLKVVVAWPVDGVIAGAVGRGASR
jgi:hypothetical protein